jgi:hypothetical protein
MSFQIQFVKRPKRSKRAPTTIVVRAVHKPCQMEDLVEMSSLDGFAAPKPRRKVTETELRP